MFDQQRWTRSAQLTNGYGFDKNTTIRGIWWTLSAFKKWWSHRQKFICMNINNVKDSAVWRSFFFHCPKLIGTTAESHSDRSFFYTIRNNLIITASILIWQMINTNETKLLIFNIFWRISRYWILLYILGWLWILVLQFWWRIPFELLSNRWHDSQSWLLGCDVWMMSLLSPTEIFATSFFERETM